MTAPTSTATAGRPVMNLRETADYMRRSYDWVKREVAAGRLISAKAAGPNGRRWVRIEDCDAYIAERMPTEGRGRGSAVASGRRAR